MTGVGMLRVQLENGRALEPATTAAPSASVGIELEYVSAIERGNEGGGRATVQGASPIAA